jgi:hypothetical protein
VILVILRSSMAMTYARSGELRQVVWNFLTTSNGVAVRIGSRASD